MNTRWNRFQHLPRWRTGGDHQDALVLRGWRLSGRTWNPITSPWMKQLTWLRIVHSGDWCLRLALSTPSGACHKRRRSELAGVTSTKWWWRKKPVSWPRRWWQFCQFPADQTQETEPVGRTQRGCVWWPASAGHCPQSSDHTAWHKVYI